MSNRQRGRGRGGGNPLAPPFNPCSSQAPTSPDDTRIEEDSPSPLQTVVSHTSYSAQNGKPTTLESLQDETTSLINQNKSLADCYQYLLKTFEALEKHLNIVQEGHIQDTQDLKDQITTCTTQVQQQQSKQPASATRTTPPSRPIVPLPTLTWAQKAAREPAAPTTTHATNKKAIPSVLTKRDHTMSLREMPQHSLTTPTTSPSQMLSTQKSRSLLLLLWTSLPTTTSNLSLKTILLHSLSSKLTGVPLRKLSEPL